MALSVTKGFLCIYEQHLALQRAFVLENSLKYIIAVPTYNASKVQQYLPSKASKQQPRTQNELLKMRTQDPLLLRLQPVHGKAKRQLRVQNKQKRSATKKF